MGCAGTTAVRTPPAASAGAVEVAPIVIYSDAYLTAEFDKGRTLLLAGDYPAARAVFDKLAALAQGDDVRAPSMFNAAVAKEGEGHWHGALADYRAFVEAYPAHPLARSAMLRETRALAYLEGWDDLVVAAGRLLAQAELPLLDRIEAHGARALGLVEQDDVVAAAREVDLAKTLIEDNHLGQIGPPPIGMAQVSFALGEVRRKRSEAIVFVPTPVDFGDALERRCATLLEAQNAYTDAMRSLDAHWSAMAGYRVGQLYLTLHRDVLRVPPPPSATTLQKRQLFEGAMRLRYRILLEKGSKMMDATVRLADRTGEDSSWVGRARDAKRDLERALEEERLALSKLPFTEADLQAALDALKTP
jgi:tetratricopeptide (TPR) repeat protein